MSILNAFVYPDHAFVCVDTDVVLPDGAHAEISKLFVLPHMNAIFATRGTVLLNSMLMAAVVSADVDFDELSRRLSGALAGAFEKAIEFAPMVGLTAEAAGCGEVVIVGFSPAMGRIVLHHFKRETIASSVTTTNNVGAYFVAPHWPDIGLDVEALRLQPNGEGLRPLAFAQVRLLREREPAAAAGGRLIIGKITRREITIESACDFPARSSSAGD